VPSSRRISAIGLTDTARTALLSLLVVAAGGCSTWGGNESGSPLLIDAPETRVTPVSPEAEAGAEFMRGRALELDRRYLEAAEAYERAARLDPQSPELQRALAQVWMAAGEPARALDYAERALALQPDDEDLRIALASLHARMRDYDRAIELLEPLADKGTLNDEGMFTLFTLYLNLDKNDQAMSVAQRMIQKDPEDVRGYLALGAAYERADKLADAERAYRRGLKVEPDQVALFDAIARIKRQKKDAKGEIAILREKLAVAPGDPAALMRIAQIYDDQKDRKAAIAALEELVDEHPELAAAQFRLGLFYYEAGRYDDAIDRFHAVLRASDGEGGESDGSRYASEVKYFVGLVHDEAGRSTEALAELEQVPPASPRFADARSLMARIYERRKEWDHAVTELKRAIAAAPEKKSLQVYLAGLYQKMGDLPGAVALMQELIAASPQEADLYYDLGVIYGEANDRERCFEQMNKALELDPNHASALNYVGYSWAEKGERLDEAERMIRKAISLKPDDGYITDSLGWLFYQRGLRQLEAGQREQARSSFNAARSQLEHALSLLEKGDPVITWHLGDAYRSLARYDDALATYKRALTLSPEDDDAAKIRAQIESLQHQLGRGEQRKAVH
jgi:tetratricopeptide (TPR) repeat protein